MTCEREFNLTDTLIDRQQMFLMYEIIGPRGSIFSSFLTETKIAAKMNYGDSLFLVYSLIALTTKWNGQFVRNFVKRKKKNEPCYFSTRVFR